MAQLSLFPEISYEHHASSSSPLFLPLFFLRDVLLGMFVSNGERGAKFIFFSDSVLTMNEAAFTKFLPTLMCLC